MAVVTSVLTGLTTVVIAVFSGGVESPFLFTLALEVIAAYMTTRLFGAIYLYTVIGAITVAYIIGYTYPGTNIVPLDSRPLFSYVIIILTIYILGDVYGKNLIQTYHRLFKSKKEVEAKIIEKENLFKEVHHRVKNNLQTVSSLLSLQSRTIRNSEVKQLFKNSQNRVLAMAMVHEMLYAREDIAKVELKPYIQDLAEFLIRSVKGTSENITLVLNVPDMAKFLSLLENSKKITSY